MKFQLVLFTAFLFLLVAIPYTIYLKSQKPKAVVPLTALPVVAKPSPFPQITPPPASTTTSCFSVPSSYTLSSATPSAYFFQDDTYQLCYPPALPPFPFTWEPYTSYQYGYTLDIPNNWIDKSTTIKHTLVHIFASEETASASATPTVSFAWYSGTDPYASQSSYLKNSVTRSGKTGTIYTNTSTFIAAVFPLQEGYLLLQSSRMDSAFYVFEHMLDSLKFR